MNGGGYDVPYTRTITAGFSLIALFSLFGPLLHGSINCRKKMRATYPRLPSVLIAVVGATLVVTAGDCGYPKIVSVA